MSQWERSVRILLSCGLLLAVLGMITHPMPAKADGAYPYVIGATGRPYGPTQAHYQYQRQYGHAWGGGGVSCSPGYAGCYPSIGWGCNYSLPYLGCYGSPGFCASPFGAYSYGSAWSSYGWGLGGYYGSSFYSATTPIYPPILYSSISPVRLPTQEGWPPQNVWDALNQQEQGIIESNPARPWVDPGPQATLDELQFLPPSTPEALIASQRNQDQGDMAFQQFRMATATDQYRAAIDAAPERAEPYFRLAVTLAARRKFLEAVNVLQQLLVVDPEWPVHGTPLADMFRAGDVLPKTQIKQRVADWVLEDVRDADRLFLLGVFLYSDGDVTNAATLLETAALIEGDADHLTAFLNPIRQANGLAVDEGEDLGLLHDPAAEPANPPQVVPALPDLLPLDEGPRFAP